jgi:4-coumarate--CoA ligase
VSRCAMAARILQGDSFEPILAKISLGEFFFDYAEKHRDVICQINGDTDESETYGSVKRRSTRLALALKRKGITCEDVIACCSYNSLDNTIPIIASTYLGAKIVNLDPTLSSRNTTHLLTLVSPRVIFVEEDSLGLIENSLKDAKINSEIVVFGKSSRYATFSDLVRPCADEDAFAPAKVDLQDIGIMFFSSGTTGLPKAICHSHYSFLRLIEISFQCGFDMSTVLHYTTFYWISGMLMLARTFMEGGTRVFARTVQGENVFKMIEKYKLTALFAAPIYTYSLTKVKDPERYDTSSFRCLLTGGTPLSTEHFKKLSCLFPTAQVIFGYGMTEVGMISVFHQENDKELIGSKIGSSGKIAPESALKVVDPNTGEMLGPNVKGEIRIKTQGMMKGYYKQDSSHCFDTDGFLKSGDIGYYDDDDCIYVIERMKEMFKYQSWHIVPSSIEAVLQEHPAVKESVVFGIPRDEEGEIPAACVVLNDNFNVDKGEIEEFVAERVSDKERLRGGVMIVAALPKTPSGKLIRKEVRNIVVKSM